MYTEGGIRPVGQQAQTTLEIARDQRIARKSKEMSSLGAD